MATRTNKKKPRHIHRWRYRWDHTVRTCGCGKVSWWWHCESKWLQKCPEENLARHGFALNAKSLGRYDALTKADYINGGIYGIRQSAHHQIWKRFQEQQGALRGSQYWTELEKTRHIADSVWNKTAEEIQKIS